MLRIRLWLRLRIRLRLRLRIWIWHRLRLQLHWSKHLWQCTHANNYNQRPRKAHSTVARTIEGIQQGTICNDRGETAMREECDAKKVKKYALDSQDECNIGRISHIICQIIWPCNKILPQKWTTFRDHPQSMCQIIMTKLESQMEWHNKNTGNHLKRDAMNNKFYNLRASLKNKVFNQFKGKLMDAY